MGSVVPGKYNYPSTEGYTARVHSPDGVKGLTKDSQLMALLQKLSDDGNDVSGPAAELVALLNYVSCTQGAMGDLETHLGYCLSKAKENIAGGSP